MKNVVGLFENMRDAEAVVRELRNAGISDADISFASRNPDAAMMESNEYIGEGHSEAAEGAGFGATGGTIVGGLTGLLVGLGALTLPGIGPVVAAGTLATALGSTALGAGIGAATGGLLGALVGAGIPEEDAHIYSEGIRRGGALVMAQVDDNMVDPTLDIMERYNVVDIDERGAEYRSRGWSRFDENTDPYSDSNIAGRPVAGSSSTFDDRSVGGDDYDRSSKIGTAGGAVAGAAAGAALGSAGGPVGTVIGGVAGAVTGGGVGAAGDAAGAAASEGDYDASGTTYGRTTDTSYNRTADYDTSATIGAGMTGTTGTPYDGINETGMTGTTGGTTDMGTTGTYDRTTDTGLSSAVGGTTDTGYSSTMGSGATDTSYSRTGDADRMPDADDYDRSSKVGTVGGAVAGAATGAAIGSAGGPVGTVIGGVAGAVTGGGVGAAGDAAGVEATDNDTGSATDYTTRDMTGSAGTAYGSTTDYGSTGSTTGMTGMTGSTYGSTESTMGDASTRYRSRTYEVGGSMSDPGMSEGTTDNMASRIEEATERGIDTDLDRDGDIGQSNRRDNY